MIRDNPYADPKAIPTIAVLPNGRASKGVSARDPFPQQSPAFEKVPAWSLERLARLPEAKKARAAGKVAVGSGVDEPGTGTVRFLETE